MTEDEKRAWDVIREVERGGGGDPPCHECARSLLSTCDCEDAKTEALRRRIAELERTLLGHGMDKQKLQARVQELESICQRLKRVMHEAGEEHQKLAAERDRLASQVERLASGGAMWAQNAEGFRKEAERLKAEMESWKRDAEIKAASLNEALAKVERLKGLRKASGELHVEDTRELHEQCGRLRAQLATATAILATVAEYGPPHGEKRDTACAFCDMGGAGYSTRGDGFHDDRCAVKDAQLFLAAMDAGNGDGDERG